MLFKFKCDDKLRTLNIDTTPQLFFRINDRDAKIIIFAWFIRTHKGNNFKSKNFFTLQCCIGFKGISSRANDYGLFFHNPILLRIFVNALPNGTKIIINIHDNTQTEREKFHLENATRAKSRTAKITSVLRTSLSSNQNGFLYV
ncbi:hypothetical protein AK51_10075 [Serratia nematodiphila DZ0503SBS1]|nr:hypothetical protein AK51_10075 [Serratia nematodiphila DZ0503SBS1]